MISAAASPGGGRGGKANETDINTNGLQYGSVSVLAVTAVEAVDGILVRKVVRLRSAAALARRRMRLACLRWSGWRYSDVISRWYDRGDGNDGFNRERVF